MHKCFHLFLIVIICYTLNSKKYILLHIKKDILLGCWLQKKEKSNNKSIKMMMEMQFSEEEQNPQERVQMLVYEELSLKPIYRLHSRILQKTEITQVMRAKLRVFLMQQCSNQNITRATYVLACYLMDLYFAHGGDVQVKQFQVFVIGCLIISCKLTQSRSPKINFEIFPKQILLEFETKIANTLRYNLNPPTYLVYAERMICLWDIFIRKNNRLQLKIGKKDQGKINIKLRSFYEQLDCAFMVLKTLDLDVEKLIVNLFYINLRCCQLNTKSQMHSQNTVEQICYSPENNQTIDFFCKFLNFYSKDQKYLCLRLGKYLMKFLNIKTSSKDHLKGSLLERLSVWEFIQTYPINTYQVAKKIIKSKVTLQVK